MGIGTEIKQFKKAMCEEASKVETGPSSRRKLHISRIRDSLKGFALISTNKTMVQKRLLQDDSLSESDSTDGLSLDPEEGSHRTYLEHTELFAQKYETTQKLGEGSDGVVHRCIKKKTGKAYAAKAIMFQDQHVTLLRYNYMLMRGLSHKNIVKYEALYLDLKKHSCWLVMELLSAPSLVRIPIRSQNQLRGISEQLLQTLHYLHQRSVTHRDVKPQNILYDPESKQLKLIDFGICRKHKQRGIRIDMLTITGTLYYRAPEMFSGGGYNEKVDIWAAGVTIYKMVTGRTPFESEYHSKTIQNILTRDLIFPEVFSRYSPALKELVTRMLRKNPKERLSAIECMRSMWFFANPSYNVPCQVHFSDQPNEEELEGYKSPMLQADPGSHILKINGNEYHCFDSDDETQSYLTMKRASKSLVLDLHNFKL